MSTERFPLGVPLNRKVEPLWVPISDRPGWFRHRLTGKVTYIAPPAKLFTS